MTMINSDQAIVGGGAVPVPATPSNGADKLASDTETNPGNGATQTAHEPPLHGRYCRMREGGQFKDYRLTDSQRDEFELPFITRNADNLITCYWRPSSPRGEDEDSEYVDDSTIGHVWAWWLISHLRKHGYDSDTLFSDIIGEIVKGGTWGAREQAFVYVLGEYIAMGRADLVPDVVAMHEDDLPPTTPDHADDGVLLSLLANFWEVYREVQTRWNAYETRRVEVEAATDSLPQGDKRRTQLYDLWNEAIERAGAAANAVFETPARTIRGAVEKLKIARLVTGIGDGSGTGDKDLEVCQNFDAPWIDNVIEDLERLTAA